MSTQCPHPQYIDQYNAILCVMSDHCFAECLISALYAKCRYSYADWPDAVEYAIFGQMVNNQKVDEKINKIQAPKF